PGKGSGTGAGCDQRGCCRGLGASTGGYEDGDVGSKVSFAVLSTRLLYLLGAIHWGKTGVFTFENQVEYARKYSAEIEYSQDNLDALFTMLM
ncbi:MAG: hypothetical protein IKB65_04965, partial [Ruminiclostridium sp.]|nr:hypothetical protein [Ruminiclostridium sp.]